MLASKYDPEAAESVQNNLDHEISVTKLLKLYKTDHLQVAFSTKSPASGAAEIEAKVCIL